MMKNICPKRRCRIGQRRVQMCRGGRGLWGPPCEDWVILSRKNLGLLLLYTIVLGIETCGLSSRQLSTSKMDQPTRSMCSKGWVQTEAETFWGWLRKIGSLALDAAPPMEMKRLITFTSQGWKPHGWQHHWKIHYWAPLGPITAYI